MATPPPQQQLKGLQISSSSTPKPSPLLSRVLEISTPRSGGSSLTDDAIWKRLREAGFDEEAIKSRDKAALIAYITRLETEIYDYQRHLGLLLLERKEWTAKYEQVKTSADSAEALHKRNQAAHLSALSEARKREENLKKALAVEKLCVTNIEKALHEIRAESAETKVASESKLAEARTMMDDAQRRLTEGDAKLHAAESLQAEASRYHSAAERKLQDVEAREDALRRRMLAFKSECDAKEKDISLERQSLFDHQKTLKQGQERLLEGQALLNQREEYIFERSQKLNRLEKELEAEKVKIDQDRKVLMEEKSSFDLKMVSLASREEAVINREAVIDKKEQELLVLQEKIASKEYDELHRLIAENEAAMEMRKSEFEAELELKRKLAEDDLETERQSFKLKEADLNHKEEEIQKWAHDIQQLSSALADKENDIAQRVKSLDEKEQSLKAVEEAVELDKMSMQKERDEITIMKVDLQKYKDSLEDEKKQVVQAQEKLDITQSERNELLVLQTKLKEEIDSFRAQKQELMAEVDDLKAEKEKFENEWQLIDEKREELQKEAERVAEERKAISLFLKDEHENLKLEKDAVREQFKQNAEALALEREAFMSKIEQEHSEWFSKIQKERMDFLRDIDLQKSELDNSVIKRREEIEQYLRENEEAFELEKAKELQHISSQKDLVARELDIMETEMKRLENERAEIALDREQREKEWSEIKKFIEELQIQREKLQKQRESLHTEREDIQVQIEQLKELGELRLTSENMALSDVLKDEDVNKGKLQSDKILNAQTTVRDTEHKGTMSEEFFDGGLEPGLLPKQASNGASLVSSPLSWVKKCTELIFKSSPEKDADGNVLKGSMHSLQKSYSRNDKKIISSQLTSFQDNKLEKPKSKGKGMRKEKTFSVTQPTASSLDESKVIFEVPSMVKNVNSETNTYKRKVVQRNESSVRNGSGEISISSDSGENTSSVGRKRQKRFSSHDVIVDIDQKHKKTGQHRDATQTLGEETTPSCIVSTQVQSPDDYNCLRPINHTPVAREEANGCADKNCEISEAPAKDNGADTSTEQAKLICSQNCTSKVQQDSLQVGVSNGNEGLQLVKKGVPSSGSHRQGRAKPHKMALKKDCIEIDEEPLKEFDEPLGEVIAESGDKVNDASEIERDNSDGEDEENATVKGKLWNFLIT